MPANPRHDQIITLIRKLRKVSVHDLTERMGVSRVTIRKDLSFLEEKGILIRTHGGAMLAENQQKDKQFSIRGETVIQEKTGIACKARDMVLEGDTIFLDAGSTTAVLARELRGKNIRVITNSLDIMNILAGEPNIIESQLKSTVLKNSRRKVILSDSSKFGKDAFSIFAGPKDIDILITDSVFKGKEGFLSLGIEVITA
jgi:DeoR family transcriptional regulator of aga operon